MGQGPWEANSSRSESRNSPQLPYEREVYYCFEQHAIYPYPEPQECSHFNIILPSAPRSSKWSLYCRFPYQNPVRTTFVPHTRHMPRPAPPRPICLILGAGCRSCCPVPAVLTNVHPQSYPVAFLPSLRRCECRRCQGESQLCTVKQCAPSSIGVLWDLHWFLYAKPFAFCEPCSSTKLYVNIQLCLILIFRHD